MLKAPEETDPDSTSDPVTSPLSPDQYEVDDNAEDEDAVDEVEHTANLEQESDTDGEPWSGDSDNDDGEDDE